MEEQGCYTEIKYVMKNVVHHAAKNIAQCCLYAVTMDGMDSFPAFNNIW